MFIYNNTNLNDKSILDLLSYCNVPLNRDIILHIDYMDADGVQLGSFGTCKVKGQDALYIAAVDDPDIIETLVHEMEHLRQCLVMPSYTSSYNETLERKAERREHLLKRRG